MGTKTTIFLYILFSTIFLVSIVAYSMSPTPLDTPTPKPTLLPTPLPEETKRVCIVFDDGWKTELDAIPILDHFGYKATFAIVTDYTTYPAFMTWDQIENLKTNGHQIVSHSVSHADLEKLSEAELTYEVEYSKQQLKENGVDTNIFVYPFGNGDENMTVRRIISQNYSHARCAEDGKDNLSNYDQLGIKANVIANYTTFEAFKNITSNIGSNEVCVLIYHRIGVEPLDTFVSADNFRLQMQYLYDNCYSVLTMKEAFGID